MGLVRSRPLVDKSTDQRSRNAVRLPGCMGRYVVCLLWLDESASYKKLVTNACDGADRRHVTGVYHLGRTSI